jgi:hypothetical protein
LFGHPSLTRRGAEGEVLNERQNMCNLIKLIEMVVNTPIVYLFTPMLYPLALPHYPIHRGKTHFPINLCGTIHYVFSFTSLGYNGVKPKVPLSLSERDFWKKVHKNYPYMGQSDVSQILWQRGFDGILRFAQVASIKGSKRGSNAEWMSV